MSDAPPPPAAGPGGPGGTGPGQPPAEPSYGRSTDGQPSYVQPTYAQPTYGRPPPPHGQTPYGRYPWGPGLDDRQPPPSQAMAWWALGLALVPCGLGWLVAVGLAIAVLVQSSPARNHGRGKAFAALGIVAAYVALVVVAVVVTYGQGADRDASGRVTGAGTSRLTDLRDGDCVRDSVDEGQATSIEVVPCASPHHAEVFATYDLGIDRFPGARQAARLAERGCVKRLPAGTLRLFTSKRLDLYYFYPQDSLQLAQDEGVICLADSAEATRGSLLDERG